MLVYLIVDDRSMPGHPLGEAVGTFVREEADRFVEDVRGGDEDLASHVRIEERELAGVDGLN